MKKKETKKEYSKRMAAIILGVALVDVQLTYILAFLGKEIAETLSITLVTEIRAVFGIYCVKAYLGKKGEEATRIKEKQMDHDYINDMEDLNL